MTQAGDHYTLALPPVTFVGRNTVLDGLRADVATTPEGWLTVTPRLTSPLFAPVGPGPSMTLTFAEQSGSFTASRAYKSDMAADVVFKGLALTTLDSTAATLGSIGFDTASTPRTPDHYDQTTVIADALAVDAPDLDWGFDHAGLSVALTDMDFAVYGQVVAAVEALTAGRTDATGEIPLDLLPQL